MSKIIHICKYIDIFCHFDIVIAEETTSGFGRARVSVQGVKSLWGNCVVFRRLGTGDTDRWHINLFISEKRLDPPKVI